MSAPEPGRAELGAVLDACPRLAEGDAFPFACMGCGDCCRARKDLLLSGLDLYRLARRLALPPHLVAAAFCRAGTGPSTGLPTLRLRPNPQTGNCPFFDAGCTVHEARPLACTLYPLGQSIDPDTLTVEYYSQTPLCGAQVPDRTLRDYLMDADLPARTGADLCWAKICTRLSRMLLAAGGPAHPRWGMAQHRAAKAL